MPTAEDGVPTTEDAVPTAEDTFRLLKQAVYVDFESYKMEDRIIKGNLRTVISCNLYTYTGLWILFNTLLFQTGRSKKELLHELFKSE